MVIEGYSNGVIRGNITCNCSIDHMHDEYLELYIYIEKINSRIEYQLFHLIESSNFESYFF